MADAAGGRCRTCLSDLSDDLLRHILFFTPAKEAASTSVLSRRWRSLWRTSGAVNLDSRSFNRDGCSDQGPQDHFYSDKKREAFLAGAEKALAATQCTVRRLTFIVEEGSRIDLMNRGESWSERKPHNLVEAVVSSPAARRVEELHIQTNCINNRCTLSFGSLPSEVLRVLRLVKCSLGAAPPDAAFPRLTDLHLQECAVSVVHLQRAIDGSPQLSTLHLKSAYITQEEEETMDRHTVRSYSLRCPAVTDLVFADCKSSWNKIGLEVDAPMLQYFRYKGPVQRTNLRLSLKPQPSSSSVPNLIEVDLQLHLSNDYDAEREICEPFWLFIQNFNTTKDLKLRLGFSMDLLALAEEESQEELLMGSSLFYLLERLELEAPYDPKSKASMVMLGNLLSCCPRVASLRLKLRKNDFMRPYKVGKEARLAFDNSVDHFRCRKRRRLVSLGAEDDGSCDQASDFPGLSNHSFSCLQSYLRRVSLHFCMEETNCLGVQLAKFFAEKAIVLEEMYIDDGSKKLSEHINTSVRRWSIGNSSTRRSSDLAVLPSMNCSTR
ncbi:hypothetical protein U9M48_001403 [Paspalum notatum var. saurae]|uniref:F-box domain-containing protein n=1 Tax=Paspalum notatum var. saurae TaxID=547442 RepID=A0AAQ3SF70_PASNO